MIKQVEIKRQHLTSDNATLVEAMANIDASQIQFTLVVTGDGEVVGTLTDGDIRRALINGASMDTNIETFINKNFIFIKDSDLDVDPEKLMSEKLIHQLPVLNERKEAISLFVRDYKTSPETNKTPIFLLAGGLGTRLRPLTNNYPKPMIEISGKPILEHIIREFARQGFCNFYLSVNFKGELIKDYFGNGKNLGVNIKYVEEDKRLGTAGSLSLIKNEDFDDILVMNGDLLTEIDFRKLLEAHRASNANATICTRPYILEVPFGVLLLEDTRVVGIDEKPVITKTISAGVYALKKNSILKLKHNVYCDMPDLIEELINEHCIVHTFEIDNNWIDIGQLSDLERARRKMSNEQNLEL